ncbi:MAG: hypothetical protein OHK0029_10720 [Armatimonadaceae bacterium]
MQNSEAGFAAPDGVRLHRRSVLPASEPWARLAVLPGYGDHGKRYLSAMTFLAEQGIACHALDFRGQGLAEGRRGYAQRWEEYVSDLETFLALDPVRGEGNLPLFLLAQSHGALVLTNAVLTGRLRDVAGVVLTAPFFRNRVPVSQQTLLVAKFAEQVLPWLQVPTDVPSHWMSSDAEMCREDAEDPLALHIATPRWFLSMQRIQRECLAMAAQFSLPLLILAGSDDQVADNDATEQFFAAVSSPDRTMEVLPGFRHEPLREADRQRTFTRIHQWIADRSPSPSAPKTVH